MLDPCTSDFHNPQEGPPAILASLLAATVQPDDRQASTAAFAQHFDRSAGQALQDVQVQDRLQGLCDKGAVDGPHQQHFGTDKGRSRDKTGCKLET